MTITDQTICINCLGSYWEHSHEQWLYCLSRIYNTPAPYDDEGNFRPQTTRTRAKHSPNRHA